MNVRRLIVAGVATAMVSTAVLGGCGTVFGEFTTVAPAPGSPSRADIETLLASVHIVDSRPHAVGYERACTSGKGCVYGPAWSDDQDAQGGRDGCDTRNNMLALSLHATTFREGTGECVVLTGILPDPYSGASLAFDRSDAKAVQIDHVYPLAAAWDMGAHQWSREARTRFANDIEFNLLAVNGPDNLRKSDGTPSQWLPPNPAYHCFYAGKYLTVAVHYGLPITRADADAFTTVSRTCR
ncbi:HNH endonuclease family protein [Rhodococcus sp. NPDC058521]|uniref:HNH endonuclease family protein n=1 Tax=Rhodococcus sp. NPDC058521 TaxID=3346536 RepID=UPI00364D88FA